MPLALVIISAVGISLLVPLTLMAIPAVGIVAGLLPLTVLVIPTVGMARMLVPLTVLAIPAVSIAVGLLPLTVLVIPAIGIATRLLPLRVLTIPAGSIATRLGRGESLTIRLRGKRTIRSGLGAQRAQSHKQAHRENNAPPSLWAHVIILLKIILHSGFVNLEGRPREKVNEFFPLLKILGWHSDRHTPHWQNKLPGGRRKINTFASLLRFFL